MKEQKKDEKICKICTFYFPRMIYNLLFFSCIKSLFLWSRKTSPLIDDVVYLLLFKLRHTFLNERERNDKIIFFLIHQKYKQKTNIKFCFRYETKKSESIKWMYFTGRE